MMTQTTRMIHGRTIGMNTGKKEKRNNGLKVNKIGKKTPPKVVSIQQMIEFRIC